MIALTGGQELVLLIGSGGLLLIGLSTMFVDPPRRRPPPAAPGSHRRLMAELDRIESRANHPTGRGSS